MALHALLSREVFDQHVMIAQADAGLGARSAPTEMAPALFLRVLARFLLLVPALVSRDEVLACIERVRLRHQWPGGKGGMSFEQFQAFLEEVLRRAGLPLPDDLDARLAAARAGGPAGDPWVARRSQQAAEWVAHKAERAAARAARHEMEETRAVLQEYRGAPAQRPLTLAKASAASRALRREMGQLEAEVERAQRGVDFQGWRVKQADRDYAALKREADVLASKARREEAQEKNEQADRVQVVRQKADKALGEQRAEQDRVKAKLARRQRRLDALAAEVAAETDETDEDRYARELTAMRERLAEAAGALAETEAEGQRASEAHRLEAAELYLQAAQAGKAEAQFRVALVLAGDGALPAGWVPPSEAEAPDKDRANIRAFRARLRAHEARERAALRARLEPFSFQPAVDEAAQAAGLERRLERSQALAAAYAHVALPDDPRHPATRKAKERRAALAAEGSGGSLDSQEAEQAAQVEEVMEDLV